MTIEDAKQSLLESIHDNMVFVLSSGVNNVVETNMFIASNEEDANNIELKMANGDTLIYNSKNAGIVKINSKVYYLDVIDDLWDVILSMKVAYTRHLISTFLSNNGMDIDVINGMLTN